jgi:hypothetical protein
MMRSLVIFFCFILNGILVHAQIVIQGKVVDSADLPIANASVYLNHTSFGTSSNNVGGFILEANGIYSGELIVSAAGYECISYKLQLNSVANKSYKFKLVKKSTHANAVVLPDIIQKKWLEGFKHALLGVTEEADNCVIENIASVYFVPAEDQNIIYAYADTPLIIHNKLLGYEMAYDLIEFSDDKNKGSYFFGYCRYRETGDKKKWAKRRQQNYYGSSMHFFRSLINKDLYQQGFSIFEIKKNAGPLSTGQNFDPAFIDPASVAAIEPVKILFIDDVTNEYYLQFNNRVIVQYNRTPHSVAYLSTKGFVQGLNDKGYTAYINPVVDKLGIDMNGAVEELLSISYSGFWVYEKLANQLPYNYQPD